MRNCLIIAGQGLRTGRADTPTLPPVSSERFSYSYEMKHFELIVLPQVQNYVKPFQLVEGFQNRWWQKCNDRVDEDTLGGHEYIQFLTNGIKVGRVDISDWRLSDSYVGIDSEVTTKQIWFFEIHHNVHRQGYGTAFAQHLIKHFSGAPLIAFSKDADEFWSNIGWFHYPRKDGDPRHRKLFVSQDIGV